MSETNHIQVFNRGILKMRDMIDHQVVLAFVEVSRALQVDAVWEWEHQSVGFEERVDLTGNTKAGITAALFIRGNLHNLYSDPETLETGMVGIGDYGFKDKTSGEYIGEGGNTEFVYGYSDERLSWVYPVDHRRSPIIAREIASGYTPPRKQDYHIVVFSAAPYSEWLEKVRHLNVLTQTSMKAQKMLKDRISKIKIA